MDIATSLWYTLLYLIFKFCKTVHQLSSWTEKTELGTLALKSPKEQGFDTYTTIWVLPTKKNWIEAYLLTEVAKHRASSTNACGNSYRHIKLKVDSFTCTTSSICKRQVVGIYTSEMIKALNCT